jgi:hypothetical protein
MIGRLAGKEIKVSSLENYVRQVSEIREAWLADSADELWFRGEDEKHHKTTLLPELYRSTKPLDKVLEMEDRLFREFKRCGVQYSDFDPEDDWNWYSVIQHHGGPTRLLDWSDGSLMAAHFATRSKMTPEELKTGAIVYVLDPHWLIKLIDDQPETKARRAIWDEKPKTKAIPEDDRDGEYEDIWLPGDKEDFQEDPLPAQPFLLETEQITRRVAAQRSRFMVFGSDDAYLRRLVGANGSRIQKNQNPRRVHPEDAIGSS